MVIDFKVNVANIWVEIFACLNQNSHKNNSFNSETLRTAYVVTYNMS